jgi:hypothetical protein
VGREPRGSDAALINVGLAGGDFALHAGGKELLNGGAAVERLAPATLVGIRTPLRC